MTKDIATVKAALEYFKHRVMVDDWNKPSREQHLEVIKAAARAYVETALSSPPAAPKAPSGAITPDNNGWRDISTAPRDGTRQEGKGALQDILMMAHIRAVETRQIFMLPSGDDCLEVTVVRKKTYGGKEITTFIYDELEGLPTPPPALDKGE